jgi:hypothetical protein
MAAPYNLDTGDPTDTSVVAQFPANERAFRAVLAAYLGGAVDATTGLAYFPILTTTQKNALVNPPTGALVYDTTLGHLYINTGTPGSPTWTQC